MTTYCGTFTNNSEGFELNFTNDMPYLKLAQNAPFGGEAINFNTIPETALKLIANGTFPSEKNPLKDGCYKLINNYSKTITIIIPSQSLKTLEPGTTRYVLVEDDGTTATWFDDDPCCLHEDTLISTVEGDKKIKDVRSGDQVYTVDDQIVEVINNIKFTPGKKFIHFQKSSISPNVPDHDIYITGGHPILVDGKDVEAQKLVNGNTIREVELDQAVDVYSLMTKDYIPVKTNGAMVFTWEHKYWLDNETDKHVHWLL